MKLKEEILQHTGLMNIYLVEKNKLTYPLYSFFNERPEGLRIKIKNKFRSYVQYGDIYNSKHLKTLKSRIWKYNGTIYKLGDDNNNESARVLFAKSKNGDIQIIHAFLKSTRKTPKKEARQAITIYQMSGEINTVIRDNQTPLLP